MQDLLDEVATEHGVHANDSADLPPTDGLKYLLAGSAGVRDARVIVRPSGTEPKIKAYLEVRVPVAESGLVTTRGQAADALAAVAADVRRRLSS
ncbi:MAG: hypothetical protein WCF36_18430 [Candidatus Nanopelagicales bacterium]